MTTHPLIQRAAAAQATLDYFTGRPFAWGEADCVRLAAFHLRQMGRTPKGLARAGSYGSEKMARRALLRTGFASLDAAVDGQGLPRIPPAAALVGDLVGLQGEGAWTSLTVALGNGRVLGFHSGAARVLKPVLPIVAWRIEPCRKP